MTIITKPNRAEREMFKHAKRPCSLLHGERLLALYEEFGIGGAFAAELAAFFLGYRKQTLQAMVSPKNAKRRGIRRNDYEYLRIQLTLWKMQRMIEDQQHAHRGPIREDGKRHRRADYMEIKNEQRIKSRERMRAHRAVDPQKWRKPKSIPKGEE